MIPFSSIYGLLTFVEKFKKFDVIIFYLKLLLMALIAYKLANIFGLFYSSQNISNVKDIILIFTSGEILIIIICFVIGYFLIEYSIDFFAWIVGRPFLKEQDKHIKDLETFDILHIENGIYKKGKNFDKIYLFLIADINAGGKIMKSARNIITIITFVFALIIFFHFFKFWGNFTLIILNVYFFLNYQFALWRYTEIRIYSYTIKANMDAQERTKTINNT